MSKLTGSLTTILSNDDAHDLIYAGISIINDIKSTYMYDENWKKKFKIITIGNSYPICYESGIDDNLILFDPEDFDQESDNSYFETVIKDIKNIINENDDLLYYIIFDNYCIYSEINNGTDSIVNVVKEIKELCNIVNKNKECIVSGIILSSSDHDTSFGENIIRTIDTEFISAKQVSIPLLLHDISDRILILNKYLDIKHDNDNIGILYDTCLLPKYNKPEPYSFVILEKGYKCMCLDQMINK